MIEWILVLFMTSSYKGGAALDIVHEARERDDA